MTNVTEPAIDELEARRIAAEWHSGQWSPLYSFCSTGIVKCDRFLASELLEEIEENLEHVRSNPASYDNPATLEQELLDLHEFVTYTYWTRHHGRGRVSN